MKTPFHIPQRGASIIELVIVLVIAGILVTFAVSRFGAATTNLHRQNLAREFKVNLERARFDSVKRRANGSSMAVVSIINETSYSVKTDLDQDGDLDPSEERIVDLAGTSGVRMILSAGVRAPVSISFDRKGHAIIEDYNGEPTDHVLFCDANCTEANATNSNSNAIYISPTGTVAMVGGADAPPLVTDPDISTVAANAGINPDVAVWTGPLPTPEPAASPSPLPSVTPLPVPSPVPGVSPTPLPACALNQRPGNPPSCVCLAPWFVGRSGKCGP